jgi:hypothetical protein
MEDGWQMTGASLLRASSLAAACLLALNAAPASAQSDVGIAIAGLVSLQPVNDTWVGSPYLDEGIGGWRPGLAIGANVISGNGFTLIGELSTTAAFEQFQTGRLIWANPDRFSREGSATTRLRDTLISGLAGYATSTPTRRVVFAGGLSYVHTTLTEDDLVVEEQSEFGLEGKRRFALTGGIDILQRLSERVSLVIGGRYSWLGRPELADQTGAGEHILRIGAGVRIGLGQ